MSIEKKVCVVPKAYFYFHQKGSNLNPVASTYLEACCETEARWWWKWRDTVNIETVQCVSFVLTAQIPSPFHGLAYNGLGYFCLVLELLEIVHKGKVV